VTKARTTHGSLRCAALAGVLCLWLLPVGGWCEENWRADFDAACSQTGAAMALSVQELGLLIGRCDALGKIIDTQEASVRKVYLKRLQMCRNLYAYVLEYKKNEQAPK